MRLLYILHSTSFLGPSFRGPCPGSPESFYLGNGEFLAGFFHLGILYITSPFLMAIVGLEEAGKYIETVGGRQKGVKTFLHGGDTGVPAVQIGFLGADRRDDAISGGHPRGISKEYHLEAVTASGQRYLGDTGSEGIPTGCRDSVGNQVHCLPEVNSKTVGGPTPTTEVLHEGNWIRGRG